MANHIVTLRVESAKLGTVISALDGSAEVLETHVEQEAPPSGPLPLIAQATAAEPASRYRNGTRLKGISAETLALQIVTQHAPRLTTLETVERGFAKHKPPFAESGASAACSALVAKGLLVRPVPKRYGLPDLMSTKPAPAVNGADHPVT